MDKKYQVFVSSTYEDLKTQRDQAVKTILRMGHLPVGMEMFNAADSTQWEIIKRHIDNSDYYVLVLAHRYGSIDKEDGISYTEKEYNYALEKGVPCLGFVIDSSVSWSPSLIETGDAATKLHAFKEKIKSRMVSFWTSSDNLSLHISAALSEVFNTKPRVGWIRANEITTSPLVAEELSRLSKENADLTARIASYSEVDKTGELISFLENNKLTVKTTMKEINEFTLMDLFISTCTSQDKPDQYEIYRTLTGDEDIRMGIQLLSHLKELALIGLVEQRVISRNSSAFNLLDKGKQVYAKYIHKI